MKKEIIATVPPNDKRPILPESEVEKQEALTLKIANYRALVDGGLMSPQDAAEEVGLNLG